MLHIHTLTYNVTYATVSEYPVRDLAVNELERIKYYQYNEYQDGHLVSLLIPSQSAALPQALCVHLVSSTILLLP